MWVVARYSADRRHHPPDITSPPFPPSGPSPKSRETDGVSRSLAFVALARSRAGPPQPVRPGPRSCGASTESTPRGDTTRRRAAAALDRLAHLLVIGRADARGGIPAGDGAEAVLLRARVVLALGHVLEGVAVLVELGPFSSLSK